MLTNRMTQVSIVAFSFWLLVAVVGGSIPSIHAPPTVLAQLPADGFDSGSALDYAHIAATPVANFSGDTTRGLPPLEVQFTDESTGSPAGWAWYFGDEDFTSPWTLTPPASDWWPARHSHTSVALPDGTIVLMGGMDADDYRNDVWRSADQGVTWTQMTTSAPWTPRRNHSSVALTDGSIVLTGGSPASGNALNDVWRSTDQGATWTQMTANASWTARQGHTSVTLTDDSIVLMGGLGGGFWNDVWRSTDQGATWTQISAAAAWSSRWLHASAALVDDSIVLMGGVDSSLDYKDDVWRSTDQGATWTQMTASGPWPLRWSPDVVALPDGSVVLMGGSNNYDQFDDVWRSTDSGATWTQITASAPWTAGSGHASVALIDGSIVLLSVEGEVWRSTDQGATWTRFSLTPARSEHSSVVLPDGSIVLLGGVNPDGWKVNEVWRSTDQGATWVRNPVNVGWRSRKGHTSVVLPDSSILLMGGEDANNEYRHDVWRSTDQGATWTELDYAAPWAARTGHTSVALPDGSIVLMGGLGSSGPPKSDVWRSTDQGVTWTQMTTSAEWPERVYHTSVAQPDGSIVLMGGVDLNGNRPSDAWRTTDNGATWTQMTASAPWTGRIDATSVALPDGSIILMGGDHLSDLLDDVWRSTDQGATWTQLTASAEWAERSNHSSVALPDGSIVLVGGYDGESRLRDVWRLETAGSTEQHPSHTYTELGIYSVALQVYNADGYGSTRKPGYITALATVYLPLVLKSTP